MRKPLIFAAVCAALAGCSLAPDYQRPPPPVDAQWPETADPKGARQVADLDWRAFFPDARLQALIAAALEYNRDMRVAAARVQEARALYGIARADRLPNVDLAVTGNSARTPADLSLSGQEYTSHRYDAGLSVLSFELDFWGRVKNLSDAALAGYLATEEAKRAFRLSLIADVAGAYLTALEMEERTRLARDTVRARGESRVLVGSRREVGLASDLDYLIADGAYQQAKADLASLENQRAAAVNALNLLVGTRPENLPQGAGLKDQGIVPDLAADLPSDVLLRRPDVLAAEQQLIAANANIGAARAAFLPRVTLTAMLGVASGQLSNLFDGSGAWSFQPVLRQPLFDFGRASANVDLAEARKVIAVAQYEKAIQQAFQEVADLLAARKNLAEQLQSLEETQKAQDQRLRLVEARYRGGVASYLEVLDAQRESFSAQQATVQVRRAWLTSAAQLYKALGGGGEREGN